MAGIYIHIPFCRHKCSYCDFVSFPDKIDYAEAYMACLYKELKMRGKELRDYTFDTVYFGGGTPSYIPPKLILGAMNQIRKCFTLSKDAEVTLELNPGTIGESKVKIYKEAGINRYSIGLQTAIDEQLADIGRIHNVRDYVYATKLLKGENFSTDVMLGLKNQSKEDIGKTIELAAACGSKHISMYALTVEDGTPIYTDYLNGELPDSDEVADMYDFGRALLKKFGFERYEISNFARPGYFSQHNSSYWTGKKYIGIGPSAHSYDGESRQWNISSLPHYLEGIRTGIPNIEIEKLDINTKYNDFIITGLRTMWGIRTSDIREQFGEEKQAYLERQAATYLHQGLLIYENDTLTLSKEGIFISDGIMSDLLWV